MRTRSVLLVAIGAMVLSVLGPLGGGEVAASGEAPASISTEICHPKPPDVCWKEGPTVNPQGKRLYFQLLDDYTIDIEAHIAVLGDLPPGRFDNTKWQNRMLNRLADISVPACSGAGCKVAGFDYLALENGVLTIREGYRWDGPSTPRNIKLMGNMRASLVHDAIYDLMRARLIVPQTGIVNSTGGLNRLIADVMFYILAIEDGAPGPAASFDVIRGFGGSRTRWILHEKFPWKWHSVAAAGPDMAVPASCQAQMVQLDGSNSRWAKSLTWFEGTEPLGIGVSPVVLLEPGIHVITLQADDLVADPYSFNYDPGHFPDTDQLVVTVGRLGMIIGTEGADRLVGTPGDDMIVGLGGDDTIKGGGGNDTICGGPGKDKLIGQGGDDSLDGGRGSDILRGGPGNDVLAGRGGNDLLTGGGGNDRMHGGPGKDTVSFASATATITADLAAGLADGQGGDTLIAVEHLIGSDKADRLIGDRDANRLWGGKGNDVIIGRGGADKLYGRAGDDRLLGKAGDDTLVGGSGVDYVNGGPGNDVCRGETLIACE